MASDSTQPAGIPESEYTECILKNSSSAVLNLIDKMVWEGDQSTIFPDKILPKQEIPFRHYKDQSGGSVAGLQYAVNGGNKWIIAWSNPKKETDKLPGYKVFTQILFPDEYVDDWDVIKNALDKSGNYCELGKVSFTSEIEINNPLWSPLLQVSVKASFDKALVADDQPESKA